MEDYDKNNDYLKNNFITKGIYLDYFIKDPIYDLYNFVPDLLGDEPKKIGEGRFCKVYLYRNRIDNIYYIIKKISIEKMPKTIDWQKSIDQEINIHSRIIHDNIVRLYSYEKDQDYIQLIMEYCRDGNLYKYMNNSSNRKGLDENRIYKYFSQIVNAVNFLHENNIIHRDIKLENILMDNDRIKLCDFGFSCEDKENFRKTFCGTYEYMAPEIIKDQPYGKAVDIWALGVLLYELFYGTSPFTSGYDKDEDTLNNILQYKLKFGGTSHKIIPSDLKDLILHLLDPDIYSRYNIKQVIYHPWLRKFQSPYFEKYGKLIQDYNYNFSSRETDYIEENDNNESIKINVIECNDPNIYLGKQKRKKEKSLLDFKPAIVKKYNFDEQRLLINNSELYNGYLNNKSNNYGYLSNNTAQPTPEDSKPILNEALDFTKSYHLNGQNLTNNILSSDIYSKKYIYNNNYPHTIDISSGFSNDFHGKNKYNFKENYPTIEYSKNYYNNFLNGNENLIDWNKTTSKGRNNSCTYENRYRDNKSYSEVIKLNVNSNPLKENNIKTIDFKECLNNNEYIKNGLERKNKKVITVNRKIPIQNSFLNEELNEVPNEYNNYRNSDSIYYLSKDIYYPISSQINYPLLSPEYKFFNKI